MQKFTVLSVLAVVLAFVTAFNFAATDFKVDAAKSKVSWVGKKITGQHDGNISVKSGTITTDKGKLKGGQIEIDMKSMTCNDVTDAEYNKKFIGHLMSDDFFGVDKYPTAKLVIKKVKAKGAENEVTADLTIKGKTFPITFPVKVTEQNNTVTAEGKMMVDRTKYDIKYGSSSFFDNLGDKAINNEFELSFTVVGTK